MKIRVYIGADPSTSQLFEDVDKVIDGTGNLTGTLDSNRKLVLMRQRKIPENSEITTKDPTYYTIAVFNVWTFWKMLPEDTKECERCGCSIIGDHKNKDGQILCTTCEEDAKKHQSDRNAKYK